MEAVKSTYLEYNLQFFAKEGPGGEKTEPASQKKLDDARKEGQVAKSREIVSAVALLVSFVVLKITIGNIGNGFMETYADVYSKIATYTSTNIDEITYDALQNLFIDAFKTGAIAFLPLIAVLFVITFAGELVQVKWQITMKPLMPKFSKINPLSGFKRIFSMQALINLLKSIVIVGVIGYVAVSTLKSNLNTLYNLYEVSLIEAISLVGNLVLSLGIKISAIYMIVGCVDYAYQKMKFKNDMMMTKQEVKEEYKSTEGDPTVKGQIKQRMRQASMRRMMQDVPKADVVITNPTHFAVALKYEQGKQSAPVVVAKGADYLAQRIKDKARESNVEIVENRPLARALYANVEIGQEIPEELYQAVAEVLAYVFGLKNK